MIDWTTIDWDAPRPTAAEIEASHQRLLYTPIPTSTLVTPPVRRLLDAIDATHVNGGGLLAGFEVASDDPVTRWFAARNRLDEYGFFAHLLGSPTVRKALPELTIPDPLREPLGFRGSFTGTLGLDGEFAATLVRGGAHRAFTGPATEAKQIGLDAVEALVGGRYDDFVLYTSFSDWAGWFHGVAFDRTTLLIDKRGARVVLICVTDND